MGNPFDILFRNGVIDNSVERVVHLLSITVTCSVLVAVIRLVCCIFSSFRMVDGGRLALNIANVGATSKISLLRVEQG